jgi:biotin carboxyl carrier protein
MMSRYLVAVNGKQYSVTLKEMRGDTIVLSIDGKTCEVQVCPAESSDVARKRTISPEKKQSPSAMYKAEAPMPGIISNVLCSVGQLVESNVPLLTIEAMKMENPISLPNPVVIKDIHVSVGDEVTQGLLLITCGPPPT